MGKIRDYEQLIELTGSEIFLVETESGTRTMSYEQLVELIKQTHEEVIGTDVTDSIRALIEAGEITISEIDDTTPSSQSTYSSSKIEELVQGGGVEIDDTHTRYDAVWSSANTKELMDLKEESFREEFGAELMQYADAQASAEAQGAIQASNQYTDLKFDEVKKSVSDGKSLIASAITEKGVETASDATFATMAENISNISGGGGSPEVIMTQSEFNMKEII